MPDAEIIATLPQPLSGPQLILIMVIAVLVIINVVDVVARSE